MCFTVYLGILGYTWAGGGGMGMARVGGLCYRCVQEMFLLYSGFY